jgi:hypothetical protein
MFRPVTAADDGPELAADTRFKWWNIGTQYWQTDTKDGICLEIHYTNSMFRWFLYDAFFADPDLAVVYYDEPTIAQALKEAHEYAESHVASNPRPTPARRLKGTTNGNHA